MNYIPVNSEQNNIKYSDISLINVEIIWIFKKSPKYILLYRNVRLNIVAMNLSFTTILVVNGAQFVLCIVFPEYAQECGLDTGEQSRPA